VLIIGDPLKAIPFARGRQLEKYKDTCDKDVIEENPKPIPKSTKMLYGLLLTKLDLQLGKQK